MAPSRLITTGCCVVGGGPAGMMTSLLLARSGVDTVVLEKHGDFLRDFRGDTIHPSTLRILDDLGLLDRFLALPHHRLERIAGVVADELVEIADFHWLGRRWGFIAMMPQWDFLDFLAGEARAHRGFHLHMSTSVTGLISEGGQVVGVRCTSPQGPIEVRAPLVIAADGRGSLLREQAALPLATPGSPIDVLWFRLSRRPTDPDQALGRFAQGRILILISRGDCWQCGRVIAKGGWEQVRTAGLAAFRDELGLVAPFLADRASEITDLAQVRTLTVRVDRLRRWHRPGLLCIGDAAHAMSPVGGVGINLAIQDAVAAATRLVGPLRRGVVDESVLHAVQRRRELPTRAVQAVQIFIQERILVPTLAAAGSAPRGPVRLPLVLRLLRRYRLLRAIPAYFMGMGVLPERVRGALAAGSPTARV